MSVIGQPVKRLEDRDLLLGEGQFAADYTFPNQLYMRVVRSTIAHGILGEIDVGEAKILDGVVEVWTGKDIDFLK